MDKNKVAKELVAVAKELTAEEYTHYDMIEDLKANGWKVMKSDTYSDMVDKNISDIPVTVYSSWLDKKQFNIWLYPSRAMSREYDELSKKPEFKKLAKQEFQRSRVDSAGDVENLAKKMVRELKEAFPAKRKRTKYDELEYDGKKGADALKEWRKDVADIIIDVVENAWDNYKRERKQAEEEDKKSGAYGKDSYAHFVWNHYTGGWVSLQQIFYETLEAGGKSYSIEMSMDFADIDAKKEVKKVLDDLVRKGKIIDEKGNQLSFKNMTYYSIRRRFNEE